MDSEGEIKSGFAYLLCKKVFNVKINWQTMTKHGHSFSVTIIKINNEVYSF